MAVKVYAWPPVGVVGAEWTVDDPVSVSRSAITGKTYMSATQPRRRMARIDVSALADGRIGAGYMEALKRLLEGGINKVRLNSTPINWHLDQAATDEASALWRGAYMEWTSGGTDLDWTSGGTELLWFSGAYLPATITTSAGVPAITVSDLPPNTLIARPGDFVTIFDGPSDIVGTTIMVLATARSNSGGVAMIRLVEAAPYSGHVSIGTQETAVFEALSMPRSVQPVGANWTYSWEFREVFANEVGGFTEINPWL